MTNRREEPRPTPGLRHNPFAALRGDGIVPASSLAQSPAETNGAGSSGTGTNSAGASIVVRREKKGRGGKAVTLVEGPGLAGRDLEALARELAKALGAGARVEDGAVVVQGEQVDRLVAWLGQRGFSGIVRGN